MIGVSGIFRARSSWDTAQLSRVFEFKTFGPGMKRRVEKRPPSLCGLHLRALLGANCYSEE